VIIGYVFDAEYVLVCRCAATELGSNASNCTLIMIFDQ